MPGVVLPCPTSVVAFPSQTSIKPSTCIPDNDPGIESTQAIAHSPHPYYANRSCNEGEGSSYTNNDPQTSQNIILAVGESGGLSRSERRPEDIVEVEAIIKDGFKMPTTVRRLRDLWELGEVTTCPRWRSNGGLGSIHYGTNSDSMLSQLSHVESDNDIIQCNNRLKLEEYFAESARIRELGKHLGMKCSRDEEDVIRVLDDWEVRDNEILSSEEGVKNGVS
ncbi:hypothetical protein VNO80_01082 [Phaseolus coccineus]|uniref:Uncharacterized protein n=1 Tax=Phaseolus coccineus TaxID=3886 RepID=A0AAN9P0Q6_PHACN